MEDELDDIVAGKMDYVTLLKEFYGPFIQSLTLAQETMETIKKDIATDEKCPTCGKPLVIRNGRFGEFIACSGFPECKYTKAIVKTVDVKCPREGCGGDILVRRTKKGKVFYSCSNWPKCEVAYWDKPTGEKCPKCGSMLVEKRSKAGITIKCNKHDCDFQKPESNA
jgi:DNA topoisomerase-1